MNAIAPTLREDDLLRGWTPQRVGRRVLIVAECGSTNDLALTTAAREPADGLVVQADHQTAGRGRQGRAWLSPRSASILCSIVLEEPLLSTDRSESAANDADRQPSAQEMTGWLTLAGAVAACEAIRETTDIVPAIKWPNDLRVDRRKLAGLLIESRPLPERGVRAWVLGIGINCLQQRGHFPPELRDQVTSLEIESREPVDRTAVARALLQRADIWLGGDKKVLATLHPHWLEYAEPLGDPVRLVSGGREYSGRTLCVDPAGGLVVQCDDGTRTWFDPMQTRML